MLPMRQDRPVGLGLRLREPRVEDWRRVHDWGTFEPAYRYQVWGPNSEAQSRAFVADAVATWETPESTRSRYVWHVEHDEHGVVGAGEVHLRSRQHRQAEISYVVHPDHWRQGYATWIAAELVRIAFVEHRCHRVAATCDPRNLASAAVLGKVGFTYEGRARHTFLLRDGWRDSELFSILGTEWPSQEDVS